MVPAHNLRNPRPGKLHAGHDLVPDGGVIGHLAKLFRIETARLAKQPLIDGNFSDIVKIAGGPQGATSLLSIPMASPMAAQYRPTRNECP